MESLGLLNRYLDQDQCLRVWPAKRSARALALEFLADKFEEGREYSEREVNEILRRWHRFDDPALLRRELFDGKFLDRKSDGSRYWKMKQVEDDSKSGVSPTGESESRLTHIAFQVADVERTVDFYARYTRLRIVHERPDSEHRSRVIWLREPEGGNALTLVIFEGDLPAHGSSGSLHHLGFAVESRDAVEEIARRGKEEGILVVEPTDLGEVVGYICTIADPDGNVLEFSHGQQL